MQPFGHNTWAKIGGDVSPFGRKVGSLSNNLTQCRPGPRSTFVPSDILIHPTVWPQQTLTENWGAVPLLGRGSWIPI